MADFDCFYCFTSLFWTRDFNCPFNDTWFAMFTFYYFYVPFTTKMRQAACILTQIIDNAAI